MTGEVAGEAAGDAAGALGDAPERTAAFLEQRVTVLRGVGPAKAALLERIGVRTVGDLVFLAPLRIECIGPRVEIARARASGGQKVGLRGRVERWRLVRRGRRRSTLRVHLVDATGGIDAVFFNQPWLRERLEGRPELEVYGSVVGDPPFLAHPRLGTDARPLPEPGTRLSVYPAAEGLSQDFLRKLCAQVMADGGARPAELLPAEVLTELDLPELGEAVGELHMSAGDDEHRRARRRIALERLLLLQMRLRARRAEAPGRARSVAVNEDGHRELLGVFPWPLTGAQAAVVADLRTDLARTVPMRRLLQGDVGSGKTAVGLYALLAAARAGGQTAFLAPTETLAEQHYEGARELLQRAGIRARLLTGSMRRAERRAVLAEVAQGRAAALFGTHALFSPDVEFQRLDLAVIDEQQRFGVTQRRALLEKGADVHALLMTATPIPRTLALTLYGDLETSLLHEGPPGRGRLATRVLAERERTRAFAEARAHLERGGRVFWIVPRIEESEAGPGVDATFEELGSHGLARFGVERIHGALPVDERRERLARVRSGGSGLLVATTVIEVGVDVPEATLCVIDGAERFGLAQLHQLRGRVGRGARDATCMLVARRDGVERLGVLARTNDGFRIAEEDLRRRGMGDLAGLRQAGENREGLSDPELDAELLLAARELIATRPEIRHGYAR